MTAQKKTPGCGDITGADNNKHCARNSSKFNLLVKSTIGWLVLTATICCINAALIVMALGEVQP